MVSLWSSGDDSSSTKKNGTTTTHESEGRPRPRISEDEHDERDREATERTRLLPSQPRPPHADGYLDPDDPAVSPYNLWTVRFIRYLTILFLVVTFLWWTLLLVSIFVSPPGLHTRGSGFFDFSFTTLTAGQLLVALLFFSAPSKAARILLGVVTAFLLADLIIIVSVHRIRDEESWPGIASSVWAVVMSIWCITTDRIVAWGKRQEEERLTGRPETRRTLAQWTAVLIATIVLSVYLAIVVFMTATLILRARDATLEFDGIRVFVDGHKYQVHLACIGNPTFDKEGRRNPTMLLEAGESPSEYDFEHWAYAAWQNGSVGRYCYWDRPGYAWSDNAPSPHSAGMSADALSEALAVTGEPGPWVLVSAGYGSVVSRIFASRHRQDIAGMLLVDPLHEDLLYRLASPGRGFLTWAYGVISPLGIQRVLGALFNGHSREDRVYGRKSYLSGKQIKAKLQENLVANSLSKNEVVTARTILSPDVPVAIVSSGISCRRDGEWERKQRDLSHLTDRLIGWDVVEKAPHEVWQTYDGRYAMERRLRELVNIGYRWHG